MKRCPTCNRTFTDANLSFCIDDGTPLADVSVAQDETTVVSPSSSRSADQTANDESTPRDWNQPAYQPPGTYIPPSAGKKRRVWPWVLAVVCVLLIGIVGLGIVAAFVIPKILRSASNDNRAGYSSDRRGENPNLNLNSNTPSPEADKTPEVNANVSEEQSAPTNEADVLSMLTDLEHDWTVANINADKKALDRILADDYVSTNPDGSTLGKAEYLRMIQRDNETQKWEFSDLKLDLKGNRATLTGFVKFYTRSGEANWQFTDKFVWRDGRWQAIGSEIKAVPKTTV